MMPRLCLLARRRGAMRRPRDGRFAARRGRFSMGYIMEKFGLGAFLKSISQMHGQEFLGQASYGQISIVPLYHPAAAIYNRASRDVHFQDFKILAKLV